MHTKSKCNYLRANRLRAKSIQRCELDDAANLRYSPQSSLPHKLKNFMENSHEALSCKPISEELTDMSGCIRKCFLLFLFLRILFLNHPGKNVSIYLGFTVKKSMNLCFWLLVIWILISSLLQH